MAWFGPNFNGRFLGPYLTDANSHSDICPGNICPGDIYPHQQYLSCYWHDLDQTLKAGSWEHLEQIPTVRWYLSRQHLSWRHLSISAISQLLLALFWPNFKGRFLGPFWTYSNCNNDICPGNICSCDICPYPEYFTCYLPNFDQTCVCLSVCVS